ncbi:MAG: ATP-binding protein [Pseudomonadota bacterium]
MTDSSGTGVIRRPIKVGLFGLLYLTLPLLVLALFYVSDRPYNLPEDYRVRTTEWVRSLSATPPATGWVSGRDNAPAGRQDGEPFTSIWYRFVVQAEVPNATLYIAYGSANFDVWQNGRRLFQTGPATQPLHYNRSSVSVPLASARIGDTVELRLTRQASGNRYGYVYIAPAELARQDATEQAILQEHVPKTVLTVMLAFATVVGAMFVLRPRQRYYGWYALTIVLWALHTVHNFIEAIPFSHWYFFALNHLLLNWLLAELFFVNRYFQISAPRLEKACAAVCILLGTIHLGLASQVLDNVQFEVYFFQNYVVQELWFLLLAMVVTSRYFVAVWRQPNFDSISLWLASGVVIGVGIRDMAYAILPAGTVPGSVMYLQFVAAIPLLLFGVQLIRQFAQDARTAELRNEQLNQIVEERTAALESTYQRLSEEERKRALAEERSRLMRDMHDGLGGQLVHALALSEQVDDEDLQRSLRLALDDLRLIVDSLSPSANSLQDLMASYRHRVSRLLQRTGFQVDWNIADETDTVTLKPNEALSVLRIVQEAVTNAVRHSGGDALDISVRQRHDGLELVVRDNGAGIPESVVERGLRNMRVRASELGAGLNISSSPGDTAVTMRLPLNTAST